MRPLLTRIDKKICYSTIILKHEGGALLYVYDRAVVLFSKVSSSLYTVQSLKKDKTINPTIVKMAVDRCM